VIRTRLALLFAAAGLAACGNSTGPNGSGAYFMRFDANGSRVEFTLQSSLLGAFAHQGNQFNALLTGIDANSNASLQIFDGQAITAKAYSGYTISGAALVGVLITYQDTQGTVYSSGGNQTTNAVITITDLSATELRGTFSGTLFSAGKPNVAITNGEFFLKRAN
jgi:hypothetical protein